LLQGIEHDFLNASGTATLDSLLDFSLYSFGKKPFFPKRGDSFDILSAESIVVGLRDFSFAPLKRNLQWEISYLVVAYATTDVVRLHAVPVPEPEIYAIMGVGLGVMGWVARRKKRRKTAAA